MQDLWLIGIGTGNPNHVTLEAVAALRDAALILVPRKGPGKEDLADLRHQILDRIGSPAPVAEFDMPLRDDGLPYLQRVAQWHGRIAAIWARTIEAHRPEGPVALLVWGDPALYDSSLRIAARLHPMPRLRVVPGISSLQALTAAHAIPLNTVGGAVTVTTGRRLRDHGWPAGAETVMVMLDGECSFQHVAAPDAEIWWGAFLGMAEQVLASGPLAEVTPRILALRAEARARHGWIMDSYLLRRGPGG
ncbi:precorrin-6A synthase (deacetylating) [Paracoccus ravus]|uniref:precorrin-6A synthase (deacetylating) n=1 Tax=Paracoccus ravus TaxID=2447760 RepID=UPI00106E633C|nr:precorrin-6A synthase (deacetylating) [Paracoccus ravus]